MKKLTMLFVCCAAMLMSSLSIADGHMKKAKEVHAETYHVFFEFDDNKISDSDVIQKISLMGKSAVENGNLVRVEGFADERGTHEYNMGLATRRIAAVVSILSDTGLKTIETVVYGEDESTSKYDGHTVSMGVGPDEGWAADRRVAIHLIEPEVSTQ